MENKFFLYKFKTYINIYIAIVVYIVSILDLFSKRINFLTFKFQISCC